MKTTILVCNILFFFGFFYTFTWASIGETEGQLISNYGPEVGAKTHDKPEGAAVALDRVSFFHDGIQHDVCIYADKSGEESIYKRPYSPVTDLEIKSWLDANAGGQSWIEVKPQPEFTKWLIVERSWRRTDGAIASIEGPKAKPRLLFHIKAKALIDAQKVEL